MITMPNDPWFACLPPCEARVPCGQGLHTVRWEAGTILLPDHADPEAELVLAALGGDKARCVEVAEAWARHTQDLTVLGIGPRGPADEIALSWAEADAAARAGAPGWTSYPRPPAGLPGHRPMRVTSLGPAAAAGPRARRGPLQEELEEVRRRRNDMLSVLAMGYGFQVRLIGHVVAAYADRLAQDREAQDERGRRAGPALAAGLMGRLMPVAEEWLGLDAGQLEVSLHHGPGWGTVELAGAQLAGAQLAGAQLAGAQLAGGERAGGKRAGRGERRRLRVSLPAGWLARVWAAGLTLARGPAGRHLVVAVERGGWPDARVLALRAPGAEPVPLDVHARGADATHWEV